MFDAALEALGARPEQTLMIGDRMRHRHSGRASAWHQDGSGDDRCGNRGQPARERCAARSRLFRIARADCQRCAIPSDRHRARSPGRFNPRLKTQAGARIPSPARWRDRHRSPSPRCHFDRESAPGDSCLAPAPRSTAQLGSRAARWNHADACRFDEHSPYRP